MNEVRLKNIATYSKNPLNDEMGLGELYKTYSQGLKAYILSKFRNADHEEVIQTVFLKMAQQSNLEKIEHPKGYLYRAVDHVVYNDNRRRQVQNKYLEEISGEGQFFDELNPERIAAGKEELSLMTHAIKQMSLEKQRLLILYRISGLSYAAIARTIKIPETTVQRHIGDAIRELDEIICLMKNENDHEHSDI